MIVSALALCLLLGSGSVASAQGGGGVLIGVNFADINFSDGDAPESDYRTGLAAGFFLNLPLGGTFSLQPEVLYSQKGTKFEEAGGEASIELDYLDIPVLARVASGSSGFALFVGPSFGFKVRARAKGEDFDGTELSEDIGDEVETLDVGLVLGAGFQTPRVFIDGRIQVGLSNVNKGEPEETLKNRVFSIMLGFRL
jgi:hypothetical protein